MNEMIDGRVPVDGASGGWISLADLFLEFYFYISLLRMCYRCFADLYLF